MLYICISSNEFDLSQATSVSSHMMLQWNSTSLCSVNTSLLGAALKRQKEQAGSAKANGREPKTCLGRVFHYKLVHFEDVYETQVCRCTHTSVVVNSAQVSSC